jgi:uncharacterized protein
MLSKKCLDNSLFRKSDRILREIDVLESEATVLYVSENEKQGISSKGGRDSRNGVIQAFPKYLLLIFIPIALFSREPFREPWGKDSNLEMPETKESIGKKGIGVKIADSVIRFHQEVISPVDGPRSHFRPTSSRYMQLAMQRYGFIKGFLMGCDRLMRENDEEWVYNTVEIDGRIFKYDPAWADKHAGPSR